MVLAAAKLRIVATISLLVVVICNKSKRARVASAACIALLIAWTSNALSLWTVAIL